MAKTSRVNQWENNTIDNIDRKNAEAKMLQKSGRYGEMNLSDVKELNGYKPRVKPEPGCTSCKECEISKEANVTIAYCRRFKFYTDKKHICKRHVIK